MGTRRAPSCSQRPPGRLNPVSGLAGGGTGGGGLLTPPPPPARPTPCHPQRSVGSPRLNGACKRRSPAAYIRAAAPDKAPHPHLLGVSGLRPPCWAVCELQGPGAAEELGVWNQRDTCSKQLHHFLAARPWASYCPSLGLSFPSVQWGSGANLWGQHKVWRCSARSGHSPLGQRDCW